MRIYRERHVFVFQVLIIEGETGSGKTTQVRLCVLLIESRRIIEKKT